MTIREGAWKCAQCELEDIPGSQKICPGCGDPHDSTHTPEERYYKLPNGRKVIDPEEIARAKAGEDWNCDKCNQPNPATATQCSHCTDALGFDDIRNRTIVYDDLAEHHDERPHPLDEMIETPLQRGQRALDDINAPRDMGDLVLKQGEQPRSSDDVEYTQVEWEPAQPDIPMTPIMSKIQPHLTKIGIGVAVVVILAVLFGVVSCVKSFTATVPGTVTVSQVTWERGIEIERYDTFHEQGWDHPYDAYAVYSERRFSHNRTEHVRWETRRWTESVQKSRQVPDTEDCSYDVDLGNGYFEEVSRTCPTTSTEYYYVDEPREEQVEITREVPVHDDWYFYQVDRWVTDRWITASGDKSDEVEWPEVTGVRTNGWPGDQVGEEKVGNDRREVYTVVFVDDKGHTHSDVTDRRTWDEVTVGEELDALYNKRSGKFSSVDWESAFAEPVLVS